jgi:hypothetical protein
MKTTKNTITKIIASIINPVKQEGRGPSKYLALVDYAIVGLENNVSERDINDTARNAYIKAQGLEKNLAQDKGYRLFNALLWRAVLVAKRGRDWVASNSAHGFHAMYKLAHATPAVAKHAKSKAKPSKAKKTVASKQRSK